MASKREMGNLLNLNLKQGVIELISVFHFMLKLDLTASMFSVEYSNLQMNNNLGKQTKVLTNKFGLIAIGLVCLSEFWFVCQNSNF